MTAGAAIDEGSGRSYFDALYAHTDDPYGLRARWYEARKRAVLMAALPCRRFRRAFEPGCGAAELTLLLAARCDSVLASDFCPRAVAVARERTRGLPNVRIECQQLPADWPRAAPAFDLIVLSELGYFLDAGAMEAVARDCLASLGGDATLVACDWRPGFAQRMLATDAVHACLDGLGLQRLVRHEEDDFLLHVWTRDRRSVAQREGLR